MGAAAVKGSDEACGRSVLPGCERREDACEVVRADADVAVVDDEVVIAGVGHKLREIADLAVGTEDLWTEDEANGVIGEFCLELADDGSGRIVEAGDAEEDLVFAGVVLTAVAGESFGHAGIEAVDGLKDADGQSEGSGGEGATAQISAGAPKGDQVVTEAGDGEQRCQAGDDGGEHPG